MAKALYGHLVGNDARLIWENDRLRARVAQLEAEVERLTLELAAAAVIDDDILLAQSFDAVAAVGLRPTLT